MVYFSFFRHVIHHLQIEPENQRVRNKERKCNDAAFYTNGIQFTATTIDIEIPTTTTSELTQHTKIENRGQ